MKMRPDKPWFVVLGLAALGVALAGRASAASLSNPGANPTRLSTSGLAFLKAEEGYSATAYKDGTSPTGNQLYSIGYGHQIVSGDGLKPTSIITPEQGEALLRADVASREQVVRDSVRVPINQNQFNALVSFAYNIGISGFKGSEVLKQLNAGNYAGAKDVWTKYWTKSSGKENPVLVQRRQREAALFAS